MKSIKFLLVPVYFFIIICFISCNKKTSKPYAELAFIDLLRGELILCSGDQFGDVSFSLSCNYEMRETFDLAVSLLHSFEYEEAEKAILAGIAAKGYAMAKILDGYTLYIVFMYSY